MQWDVRILIYACVTWSSVAIRQLGYFEGDICKQDGGTLWTCIKQDKCTTIGRAGIRPDICSFQGQVPIVCCEPEKKSPPKGRKSKRKCEEYKSAVFGVVSMSMLGEEETEDLCPSVEPLVSNRQDANAREFPHMALIGSGDRVPTRWFCGGSLISERYVLSAAHCSEFRDRDGVTLLAQWARLGEYNLMSNDDINANPMNFKIEARINHPSYKETVQYIHNDIALYRLKDVVIFSEYMRPACVLTDHQFARPANYVTATGWGLTNTGTASDVLQKVNFTLTPTKICSDRYVSIVGRSGRLKDESQICVWDRETKKETCKGDSGGPLQLRLEDPYCMYSVIGITSFGSYYCGNSSRPTVYTRVSHYVPWIESVVWP